MPLETNYSEDNEDQGQGLIAWIKSIDWARTKTDHEYRNQVFGFFLFTFGSLALPIAYVAAREIPHLLGGK